jgi:transposase
MTPEKLFHQMLGLGNEWQVIDCRFDENNGVFLQIKETPGLWTKVQCPKCAGAVTCHDHTEVLEWRHLNVFEHHCHIKANLPRSRCARCQTVQRVTPPWEGLSKHFTRAFEAYILLLAREMPMARVARVVGETDTRLWRLVKGHVNHARAQEDFSNVTCVGIDELAIRKGHQYLTVFADLVRRRVLFGTPGKDNSVVDRFAEDLYAHNGHPHALLEVSMDMSHAYRKGVSENCRNARIVYDKYHVIANVNAAVDQVRRAESCGPAWLNLRKTMWLWRKNPAHLDAQESARLQELQSQHLWTAKAYQMRLTLQEIYHEEDELSARQRLLDWCQLIRQTAENLPKTLFAAMLGVAAMVEKHLEGILAHWAHKVTNAYMEGLNSVFSATKRKARGYRTTESLLTMLYLVAGKLTLPHSTHWK